ncbi:hypothetical protein FKP32DRAFT_1223662 [Trametes sanguinea]|nr:hypothetical protein FKP32DRAFT_1223662 [Trametes sanguinea]
MSRDARRAPRFHGHTGRYRRRAQSQVSRRRALKGKPSLQRPQMSHRSERRGRVSWKRSCQLPVPAVPSSSSAFRRARIESVAREVVWLRLPRTTTVAVWRETTRGRSVVLHEVPSGPSELPRALRGRRRVQRSRLLRALRPGCARPRLSSDRRRRAGLRCGRYGIRHIRGRFVTELLREQL